MSRSLYITINEGPQLVRRLASGYADGASGPESDEVLGPPRNPEADVVLGPPRNPEDDEVLGPPRNPEDDEVLGPPRNPEETYTPYGYPAGTVVVPAAATVQAAYGSPPAVCCCGSGEATKSVPDRPGVTASDYSGFVILRLTPGIVSRVSATLWDLAVRWPLAGLRKVLESPLGDDEKPEVPKRVPACDPIAEPEAVLHGRPLIVLLSHDKNFVLDRAPTVEAVKALENQAAATALRPLNSLNAYWRLDLRDFPDLVEEILERLKRLAEVDLAYRELIAVEPAEGGSTFGQALAEDQGYLDDAPVGIGARWAWRYWAAAAGGASSLTLCDLEQGWNPNHSDFQDGTVPRIRPALVFGANRAEVGEEKRTGVGNHGTAVLGQLAALGKSDFGVRGAAAEVVNTFLLASHYLGNDPNFPFPGTNGHVAAAIVNTIHPAASETDRELKPGDVLLLEVQRGLRPTELDAADFDAIRLASALGVIVVEAAGNGGFDLDAYVDPDTRRSFRRGGPGFRDSGAILVGASWSTLPHDRASFSNYGSRLDCFGWGDSVTSCGYGNLAGQDSDTYTDYYTNTFSGTSSAAPLIAGAAVLVQALHLEHAGYRLTAPAMRAVLSDPASGTRQGRGVGGFIGIMPDLRKIARDQLQLVPEVYLRRHVCDDGTQPYRGDEVSSSPDIALFAGSDSAGKANFGSAAWANHPAPGAPFDPAAPAATYDENFELLVRLCNRGGSAAGVDVRLFASPAATLITPERWFEITPPGKPVTVTGVREGDTPAVGGSVAGDRLQPIQAKFATLGAGSPTDSWTVDGPTEPPLSFLAVHRPSDEPDCGHGRAGVLPPGTPYFDWAAFRAFLRGPGVACRNAHAVAVGDGTAPRALAFLLAGAPDLARYFDFEVIQRLPAGAEVTLFVPAALGAKLRQRQPWLGNGPGELKLPKRRRTTIEAVRLAAGVCARTALRVTPATGSQSPIEPGHSLAIRQLWRGEEVGRITWWFVAGE